MHKACLYDEPRFILKAIGKRAMRDIARAICGEAATRSEKRKALRLSTLFVFASPRSASTLPPPFAVVVLFAISPVFAHMFAATHAQVGGLSRSAARQPAGTHVAVMMSVFSQSVYQRRYAPCSASGDARYSLQ